MYQQLSVDTVPSRQRFDVWNDWVSQTFFPMVCERPRRAEAAFAGEIQSMPLETIALSTVASSPLKVLRRRQDIASQDEGHYLVKVQLQGNGLVRQRGCEAMLQPGDFVICSSIEPYELVFGGPHREAVLTVPQALLKRLVRNPDRHIGLRKQKSVAVNGLLTQFVGSLDEQMPRLTPDIVGRLEPVVLDLLVTALSFGETDSARGDVKGEYLCRTRQFIQRNLHDADLSPLKIASAIGISTRYLHHLFREEGISCCRYIQRQRLEGCRQAFGNAALDHLGTSDIAFRHGFNDAAHFSRRFRAEYGCSPSEFRRGVRRAVHS